MRHETATTTCGESKFVDLMLDEVAVDGTISGYASVFGRVDLGKDVVERGAFVKSLRGRGAAGIRMLFQHDPNQPIGAWMELREDHRGLFVRGRLARDVARAREVHNLLRGGALDGLSIGFRAVKARKDPASGIRHIIEADLWEISIVTFPMLPEARIDTVKHHSRTATGRRIELEAGHTSGEARFADLVRKRHAIWGSETQLAKRIREATRMIKPRGNSA